MQNTSFKLNKLLGVTDTKTLLLVILKTVYSVNVFLFVWLCNPAFEVPYNNKSIDW